MGVCELRAEKPVSITGLVANVAMATPVLSLLGPDERLCGGDRVGRRACRASTGERSTASTTLFAAARFSARKPLLTALPFSFNAGLSEAAT